MTIDRILTAEEGQTFDRKSLKIAPKDLANTIVAFANSDGGTIAIGVSDATKRIEGVDDYCSTIGYSKSVRDFLMESRGYVVEKRGIPTPTVAAILLFGKQPQQFFPYAKIRFIRYAGTEEKTGA